MNDAATRQRKVRQSRKAKGLTEVRCWFGQDQVRFLDAHPQGRPPAVLDAVNLSMVVPNLIDILDSALRFVERYEDVRDGDYGVPEPNEAMVLASEIRRIMERLS